MATMNLRRATTKTKDKGGAGDRAPEKLVPDQGKFYLNISLERRNVWTWLVWWREGFFLFSLYI